MKKIKWLGLIICVLFVITNLSSGLKLNSYDFHKNMTSEHGLDDSKNYPSDLSDFDVTCTYIRYDNFFNVTLEIVNLLATPLLDVNVTVRNHGVQYVYNSTWTRIEGPSEDHWHSLKNDSETSMVEKTCILYYSWSEIPQESTLYLSYEVVPVLYTTEPSSYRLADWIGFDYKTDPAGTVSHYDLIDKVKVISDEVEEAFKCSDYLIATNPYNLFRYNNNRTHVNILLANMAELAREKYGVLGYLYTPISFWGDFDEDDRITCGDINGDGRDEILVAQNLQHSVDIFYEFGDTRDTVDGVIRDHYLYGLACGDADRDGDDEIFVANNRNILQGGDYVTICNDPSTLNAFASIDFTVLDGFACGDINGDGYDDFMVGKPSVYVDVNVNVWLTNFTDGKYKTDLESPFFTDPFVAQMFTIIFGIHYPFACGDVNGDGTCEIIVLSENGYVNIFFKYFKSDFWPFSIREEQSYEVIYGLHGFSTDLGLACGDVDGDGSDEIVIGDPFSHKVWIWSWQGSEVSPTVITIDDANFEFFDSLVCKDVVSYGDGLAEVCIADASTGEVRVYESRSSHGDMALSYRFQIGFQPGYLFACGNIIDRWDDICEVIVGTADTDPDTFGDINMFINDYDLKFSFSKDYNFDPRDEITCGDINRDGREEIIIASTSTNDAEIIYKGGPWRYNTQNTYIKFDIGDEFACGEINRNDVLGDNRSDFIIAHSSDNKVYPYFNWGWFFHPGLPVDFSKGDRLTCGNIDKDHDLEIFDEDEIIVGDTDTGEVKAVFDLAGNDVRPISVSPLYFGTSKLIACGDVDNVIDNGKKYDDIIIADQDDNSIAFFDYSGYDSYHAGNVEGGLSCGDVDGDGKDEILVASINTEMIDIWDTDLKCSDSIILDSPHRLLLDDLTDREGIWSKRLLVDDEGVSQWWDKGFLLIVGETEIIPAGTCEYNADGFGGYERVRVTDLDYANTDGDKTHPELRVGRIIGKYAEDLVIPIQTSVKEWRGETKLWEHGSLMVFSGYYKGKNGKSNWCNFIWQARQVLKEYESGGWYDDWWIHCGETFWFFKIPILGEIIGGIIEMFRRQPDQETDDPMEILQVSRSYDIIHLAGHGDERSIDVIHEKDHIHKIKYDLAPPVIYISGCLCGRYVENWKGYCPAEAFLKRGAAVCIAATETGRAPYSRINAKEFYKNWNWGESVSDNLNDVKRDKWRQTGYYWSAIYNLYGDPKYCRPHPD